MTDSADLPDQIFTSGDNEAAPEPIDAVYLWVDGADPQFRQAMKAANPAAGSDAATNRFRDNDELKFSLRSLGRFAPWIRRVFLVTSGQAPEWLNRNHPRLTLVTHEQLFRRKSDLPAFNSNAIELQLHRIDGLSRRFLYLNDDVFFGRPSTPASFVRPCGRRRIYLQPTPLHADASAGPTHDRSYAHTQNVIENMWGRRLPRFLPAHVPQIYDRDVIAELEAQIPDEFAKTASHRFRSPDDLVLRVLYFSHIAETGGEMAEQIMLYENSDAYRFVRLGDGFRGNLRALRALQRAMPYFFCINDDLDDALAARLTLLRMRQRLQQMFPRPSEFEAAA